MINKSRRKLVILILVIIVVLIIIWIFASPKKKASNVTFTEISPRRGTIATYVSTTGTVAPLNRLQIIPPINGRVESILVNEGDHVKAGQVLLWMSSTDRAALIDAARARGESEVKYWENIYKPIALVAPITGTVIVRALEPGQTATTSTAILVLSDVLLVKANVDETDIGRVKAGQSAEISLDAYPDVIVSGRVILIKYESTTINNVTTYEVDIQPVKIPSIYKSGMSANIKIFDHIKKNVLLLPDDALVHRNNQTFVLMKNRKTGENNSIQVQTGLDDDQNSEIISGISETNKVVVRLQNYVPQPDTTSGKNPFMPSRPGPSKTPTTKK